MSSNKARRTSSRFPESHRSTPPAAETPQIRVESSAQVDDAKLTAALRSLNLDSQQLPNRATSRAGSGSRSPALGSSNIKAGKGNQSGATTPVPPLPSDKVNKELDRFKSSYAESAFASKSEQIQFLCKITGYIIKRCSSLMEENQEKVMVAATNQVEISAGMGGSGTKIIPFSRFNRNHYASLQIAQPICVPIERLTAEVDKFLDTPLTPRMDAAAGTKSTNVVGVSKPGEVFEMFWEGQEMEWTGTYVGSVDDSLTDRLPPDTKVIVKIPIGQKHKLRGDLERSWTLTTGENEARSRIAINIILLALAEFQGLITKSLVVPEFRISRNSEGPEFVNVIVGNEVTTLTGYTDYALIHAPISRKRGEAISTDLGSLRDEDFQSLSKLVGHFGEEATRLGILFIEAKKFHIDGQNLSNAEPQAVAQSIAALIKSKKASLPFCLADGSHFSFGYVVMNPKGGIKVYTTTHYDVGRDHIDETKLVALLEFLIFWSMCPADALINTLSKFDKYC